MTEAACLLQTGAMYPLRLGLRPTYGDTVFLGVKPGALSIYCGDAPIFHFDLEGRWQRAFIDGIHYLKSLDTAVHAIDRVRDGDNLILKRRALSFAEATDLDDHVRSMAIALLERIGSTLCPLPAPDSARTLSNDQARGLLELVVAWDAAAWFAHRERYLGTYGPLPFLPPDSANPVIVQSTLGHAKGVGFGGEAKAAFYERSPQEFADHVDAVSRLLGRRILQYRQVFLAGGDALQRPIDAILSDLDATRATFPVVDERPKVRAKDVDVLGEPPCLEGFHAFLHEYDRPAFTEAKWKELKLRHLKRLILGIESGSKRVRSLYGRTWLKDDVRKWIASSPVTVGLVVVVGAGGREGAADHVNQTVELLAKLKLRSGTLVSLVDAGDLDSRPVSDQGFEPLDREALTRQRFELKAKLGAALIPHGVKVTTYSTEKRWQ